MRAILAALCAVALVGCGGASDDRNGGLTTAVRQPAPNDTASGEGDWERLLASSDTCPDQRSTDLSRAELEASVQCLVQHARDEHGAPELTRVDVLDQAAADKASDILECGSFSHTACDRSLRELMSEHAYGEGCRRVAFAENLGIGEGAAGSPRTIVLGWLRSPGHRRNLLADRWRETGLAVAHRDEASITLGGEERQLHDVRVWVQHFGRTRACS